MSGRMQWERVWSSGPTNFCYGADISSTVELVITFIANYRMKAILGHFNKFVESLSDDILVHRSYRWTSNQSCQIVQGYLDFSWYPVTIAKYTVIATIRSTTEKNQRYNNISSFIK